MNACSTGALREPCRVRIVEWALRGSPDRGRRTGAAGIRVNAVLPGAVATPMLDQIRPGWRRFAAAGRLGTPTEIADAVAFLISDAASFITGPSSSSTAVNP